MPLAAYPPMQRVDTAATCPDTLGTTSPPHNRAGFLRHCFSLLDRVPSFQQVLKRSALSTVRRRALEPFGSPYGVSAHPHTALAYQSSGALPNSALSCCSLGIQLVDLLAGYANNCSAQNSEAATRDGGPWLFWDPLPKVARCPLPRPLLSSS